MMKNVNYNTEFTTHETINYFRSVNAVYQSHKLISGNHLIYSIGRSSQIQQYSYRIVSFVWSCEHL